MEQKVHYYEMFTPEGNLAVHNLITSIEQRIDGDMKVNENEIIDLIKKGLDEISGVHPEVNDTEPEQHLTNHINKALKRNGYGFEISRFSL